MWNRFLDLNKVGTIAERLCRHGSVWALDDTCPRGKTLGSPDYRTGDANVSVAFDGQLHERIALARRLSVNHGDLDDADLVRVAWEKWGTESVDRLLGDFAFVVWDRERRLLFAARDVGGARPLYYARGPRGELYVLSDLRMLLDRFGLAPKLDLGSVRACLATELLAYLPERTLLDGVCKVPPGHALTFDGNVLRVTSWWSPDRIETRRHASDMAYVEEASEVLREAVICRLQGAGDRVGAHVSGGLDCSGVAMLAQRELAAQGRTVVALSWSPPYDVVSTSEIRPGRYGDERVLVEAVADAIGMDLRYTRLTVDDIVRHASRDLTVEPSRALEMEFAASREVSAAGIGTVLSGWGGDEFIAFNGRGYFSDLLRRGRVRQLNRAIRNREQVMGIPAWKQWVAAGLMPLLPFEVPPRPDVDRTPLPSVLNPDFAEAIGRAEPAPQPVLRERPGVRQMQLALLRSGHLSERIEAWASHGATAGINYLYPLLDRRVIEFALSVPDHLFMRDGWKRWLYRAATEGLLPDEVRWNRHKMDPASFEQARRAYEAARPAFAARLRERDGHPLVDVQAIARAVEQPAQQVPAEVRWWRRAPVRSDDPQNAAWLAYVDPVTGW